MVRNPLAALLVCFSAALVAFPAPADKPKAAPATSPKLDVARLKRALETGSEAERLSALTELATTPPDGAPAASAVVSELLVRGATVRVLEKALETLEKLAQPAASPAIAPYARHRTPALRRSATLALARTGGPAAVTALRAVLRGSDQALRRRAASALRDLKAADAVGDLFAVLGKDVPEAAGAIGELCTPTDCQKLVEQLGKMPFDVMQSGLEPIVLRPDSEIPEALKLDLLDRLGRLQTKEASVFLKTVRARFPKDGNARIRAALEAAVSGRPVKPTP